MESRQLLSSTLKTVLGTSLITSSYQNKVQLYQQSILNCSKLISLIFLYCYQLTHSHTCSCSSLAKPLEDISCLGSSYAVPSPCNDPEMPSFQLVPFICLGTINQYTCLFSLRVYILYRQGLCTFIFMPLMPLQVPGT